MVFTYGGLLTFHGGFEYFSPASWQYNPVTKQLKIKVKVVTHEGLISLQKNLKIQNAYLKKYKRSGQTIIEDVKPEAGEVTYRLGEKLVLNWLGWNYYKKN